MSWRRAWVLAVAGALLASCGGGGDEPSAVTVAETTPTSTTTTEATTTTVSAEAAVEEAFYAQWDAFIEILSDPDPADPLIDRYFTGPAREQVLDTIAEYVAEGKVARLPEDPSLFQPGIQRIELVSQVKAVVVECTLDGSLQIDQATGEVVDGEVYRVHFRNSFVLEDGEWKVEDTSSVDEREPPCDFG